MNLRNLIEKLYAGYSNYETSNKEVIEKIITATKSAKSGVTKAKIEEIVKDNNLAAKYGTK